MRGQVGRAARAAPAAGHHVVAPHFVLTDHAHSSHDAVCMPLPGASAPAAAPPTIACAATTCQVRHLDRTNASSHHAALARRAPRLTSWPRSQCTCWQPADCRPVLRQQLCPSPPSPSPVFRCRYGTACTRRRCAAPAPPLRRSRVVTAPLLRRRRAAPALPLCLPTVTWACVCGCRAAERQRGRGKRQRHREPPAEMQSARARNAIGQAVSVLTSHYCLFTSKRPQVT